MSDELAQHQAAWASKSLLRRVYRGWYERIARELSAVPGPTVDIGSGIGRIKEVIPTAVTTDVEPTPWADLVVDAEQLPFEDGSRRQSRPARRLPPPGAAGLVPRRGGARARARRPARAARAVLLAALDDRLPARASRGRRARRGPVRGRARARGLALDGERRGADARVLPPGGRAAEALAGLAMVERRRLTLFVYILSGGYSRRPLAPGALYRPLSAVEWLLSPLLPVAAFRCLVVLERR